MGPARSKNQGMHGTFMRENREIPCPPVRVIAGRAAQGTLRRHAWMHEHGKSDGSRSTCEAAEQGRAAAAEVVEGRGPAEGNTDADTYRTQCRAARAKRAGSCARGGTNGQGGAVHRAAASR